MLVFLEKSLDQEPLLFEENKYIDDNELDFLFEAAELSHIMKEKIYPKIEEVLSTSAGDQMFKRLVGEFMRKNDSKLHTAGPQFLIVFGDTDKNNFFQLFHLTKKEIVSVINEVLAKLNSKSEFMLLRGNPIFWIFYLCIRYYTLNKDQKGLNTALAIYALSVYPSVFSTFFPHGANEGVMQYTIDHLTEKYTIKQAGHIFGALFISIQHSYEFLSPYIEDANDSEIIRFIQRIRNDQKSMIKKICDQYMINHAKGLRVTLKNDSQEDGVVNSVDAENKTSIVENVGRKVTLNLITQGIELQYISIVAKIANVSIADTRLYISKIITEKYTKEIEKFIETILFLYLYDENKHKEDINSSQFLKFADELFRKTNSNNVNIKFLKDTLNKWGEETGVHAKFKREASRVNYKKAIFYYFILAIQRFNN